MKKNKSSLNADESIDCVAMKNRIQSKTYQDTKGMSLAQENAYREKNIAASPLADMWKKLKAKSAKNKKTAV